MIALIYDVSDDVYRIRTNQYADYYKTASPYQAAREIKELQRTLPLTPVKFFLATVKEVSVDNFLHAVPDTHAKDILKEIQP